MHKNLTFDFRLVGGFVPNDLAMCVFFWPLHMRSIRNRNHRADDYVVALEFAAFGVVHADRAVLVQNDPAAIECLHRSQFVKSYRAVIVGFDDWLLESLASRAADVECAHRQLCPRLAD